MSRVLAVFESAVLKSSNLSSLWQSMRGIASEEDGRSAKGGALVLNAASKIVAVVDKMLLPLLDISVGTHVRFVVEEDQAEFDLFDEVRRRRPACLADADTFALHARSLYERYMVYCGGA
jgi:hypothetical protein